MSVSVSSVSNSHVTPAAQDPWRSSLPVPMSHYRQQIIKPPFVFNPREGLLQDILEKETGVSNKFPGIDVESQMAHCYENLTPEQQQIVKDAVGEENIPKPTKPKVAPEVPKPAAKPAAKATEQAAKSSKGKWGWIAGGVGLVAAAIGGKSYMDNKKAHEQLNLSA